MRQSSITGSMEADAKTPIATNLFSNAPARCGAAQAVNDEVCEKANMRSRAFTLIEADECMIFRLRA